MCEERRLPRDKPKWLAIDLETRSEIDLTKCGVHRYVEGKKHKILLFCYQFEGDADVTMIDMATGEQLPPEVLSAIDDPEIIKTAWNAQFERTVIGHYLGRVLSPDSWQCTMVWAAGLSLPLSLKLAAQVLRVEQQKDRAGDALIKKFSVPQKPSKSNGFKEWIEPEDAPEDWDRFKEYCKQDVRTEVSIREKLMSFPLPDHEWDYYHMDQRINDRGVMIDTELVHQAIACDLMLSEAKPAICGGDDGEQLLCGMYKPSRGEPAADRGAAHELLQWLLCADFCRTKPSQGNPAWRCVLPKLHGSDHLLQQHRHLHRFVLFLWLCQH